VLGVVFLGVPVPLPLDLERVECYAEPLARDAFGSSDTVCGPPARGWRLQASAEASDRLDCGPAADAQRLPRCCIELS
jgi:hypothetical protein